MKIMKKNVVIILSLIVIVAAIGHILSNTFFFKHLELLSYDLRSKLNSDKNVGKKEIVIVAIDDYSKKALLDNAKEPGTMEWEKNVWKNVVTFIQKGEPKAIMFDMVFENLEDKPWYDATFANRLIKYNNVILGTYLDSPVLKDNNFTKKIELEQNDYIPTTNPLDVKIDNAKLDKAITYTENAPVNNLYTQHNKMAVLNNVLDDDSVVRRNQPIFKLVKNGETYYMPSLAFAGFLEYMGEKDTITIKNNNIYYKGRVIPIDNDGITNISWHKKGHGYLYVPIAKILLNKGTKDDIQPEFFKDKLVIIGKTVSGRNINLDSIISSSYLGPEATAVALDNFINDTNPSDKSTRRFISEVPKPLQILITVIACIIVAIVGLASKSALIGCLNGFISIFIYLLFSFWLFVNPSSRIWIPIAVPLYYLTVTSGIVFAYRIYHEFKKRNSMMNAFGKFLAPKVLANVIKNPNMTLKNTKKRITILFCDVKDFSSLSEKYDAEKLVSNLNELFKEVVNVIFENNGTVDKFIGDCVMAYWGDLVDSENEEFLAVKTALEIKKRVNELKVENAKENKIIFDVKIGINTGEAVLGLAGTDKIMSYTAMGDAVNTASRLESACATLKRDILISKSTYEGAKDKIIVLDVGTISVKGKEEQIEVYEPIGIAEDIIENIMQEEPKTLTNEETDPKND